MSGLGGIVYDCLARGRCEEGKDDLSVGEFEAKHVGDEACTTESIDGDNVGIRETSQPFEGLSILC